MAKSNPGDIEVNLIIPAWALAWLASGRKGVSSETIMMALLGLPKELIPLGRFNAPHDTDDVGRCVQLLDLAAANGCDWRARLPEVGAFCVDWALLAPAWLDIEQAYHEDRAAQQEARRLAALRKDGRRRVHPKAPNYPPSRCWWLVSTLRGHGDPYDYLAAHPFEVSDA